MRGKKRVRAIGYIRVSTDRQADSGAGLEVQRKAIRAECKRRNWNLAEIVADNGASGKDLDRPGLAAALAALERGDAEVLMASKLDRISRSVFNFSDLLVRSRDEGWSVVTLDAMVDTTTPAGRLMIQMLSMFAEFEREMISERTRAALAVKKAQGVKLGRKVSIDPKLRERMRRLRRGGKGWSAIANVLNSEGIPTSRGGKIWHPNTVRAALNLKR